MSIDITVEELRELLSIKLNPEQVALFYGALVEVAAGHRVTISRRAWREALKRSVATMRARSSTRRVAEVMEVSVRTVYRWDAAERERRSKLRHAGEPSVTSQTDTG